MLFAPFFFLTFLIGIASTAFWIAMLVHVATHENKDQLMWVLILVFTQIIGALIYYFTVVNKPENIKTSRVKKASKRRS